MSLRPLRSAASLVATLALVAAGIAATSSAAQAVVVPGSDPCPAAYNPNLLTPGQAVTGLTTTIGTTPEEFHGTYQRTIADGIAPGMDLLVFKMSGSRITDGGAVDAGIWAGMSGSPVYDDATGDLIGAVSYGFSTNPSDIAGVTPAKYMYDLSNPKYNPTNVAAHSGAKVSSSVLSSLQKKSDGNAALGQPKMLRPKKQITGGADADLANAQAARSKILQKNASYKKSGFLDVVGQTSTPQNDPIVVGGNLATTFSYGEVTTASVGTVTAICGDKVIGYGHPDEFSGKSSETFHGASVVAVQPDVMGSYKLANIGMVKGVINQDRMQGILGTLGQVPHTTAVVSHTSGLGDTKTSTTQVSVPFALPYVVATQAASDAQTVLNQNSSGDALMTWTFDYTRENGDPETFTRTQRISTSDSFPDAVSYDVATDLEQLMDNPFETIKITHVSISTDLKPDYHSFQLNGAQYKSGSTWKDVANGGVVSAKAGAPVHLRLKLKPSAGSEDSPATIDYDWYMSGGAVKTGTLRLYGQAVNEDFEGDFGDDESDGQGDDGPQSFDELLDQLSSQPRQDTILGWLRFRAFNGGVAEKFRTIKSPAGIVNGNFTIKFAYKK